MRYFQAHAQTPRLSAMLALALSLGLAASLNLSQAATSPSLQEAQKQFQAAAQGESAAIDKAAEAFAALLKADPGNPMLMAKLGAATTLRATTTLLPWKKMSHAEEGLAHLDKALAALSSTHEQAATGQLSLALDTRFTAASTFLALPSLFNRGPRGAKLLGEVLNNPQFAQAPLAFRGSVWMRAAQTAEQEQRKDEARRFYQLVQEHAAPQAAQAQAQLKALQS